ncbi:peptidase M76 family-domain-containing protein [Annulohypoxylon maeteangense]|uniref:peptidase M76 family-domain-containing protein n=1 Tax=Annulohypoxylon maeteangense TaxID=1927788 RepID=UPI0020085AF1|nr:peptidase M76 family-domain-containing protein [Annulohypoxylon maeteangense]KAI0887259.1 peptidase M76 family-domain-containing protein [Annulohypoxylon maeteangense]
MSSPSQSSEPPVAGTPVASTPTAPSSSSPDSSQPDNFPRILTNDPARTGFDPQTAWWINYFKILTGSMTKEGAFHYRESRYREHEARDCARCEEFRDWAFAYSPTVRFLHEKINALNGNLDASNVSCKRCPTRLTEDGNVYRSSGGFHPSHGILICANEVSNRHHFEDILSHEMVHAWDHLRWKVDFMAEKGLKHAACTEIRAAMLSGECRWTREAWKRGNWTLTQQFQDCVRKRAVLSLLARPKCKDDVQAVKVVNQVWDSCFSDTRPFDEVYR